LIKGFPTTTTTRTTTTTKQNVDPAVYYVYSRVKTPFYAGLKMYTKLASIEINDEILSKVGEILKFFGKNFFQCEN
jgi:hypothetical protein